MLLDYYQRGHELSDGELYRHILHDRWRIFRVRRGDSRVKLCLRKLAIVMMWSVAEIRGRD